MVTYLALFDPDREAGGFVVTFPDFGYGVTQGETLEEATELAQDLLAGLCSDLIGKGEDLPKPAKFRGRNYSPVTLPALQSAKVELYRAFRSSGIRKSELARRIGMQKTNLDRLFELNHQSRLDQLETAFAALNKKLRIEVRNAA
ncbi:MAG: type II toxin-antitoxin system HicB family antitoxin [Bryobacteraceae bacterium]